MGTCSVRLSVDHAAVVWPGDIDLAPDAVYMANGRRGVWELRWRCPMSRRFSK
jgi:hypothetical protein